MTPAPARREGGFTLPELIVSIAIISIIGAALAESVILAMRSTDDAVARISGSVASETLAGYFSADARSADDASDPADAACSTGDPAGVFLRLRWTDGAARQVEYALEPPAGGEQDLVRWLCVEGDPPQPPQRRFLGHFTHDPAGPAPVVARCDRAACPAEPADPVEVSLLVSVADSAADELRIRRRSG